MIVACSADTFPVVSPLCSKDEGQAEQEPLVGLRMGGTPPPTTLPRLLPLMDAPVVSFCETVCHVTFVRELPQCHCQNFVNKIFPFVSFCNNSKRK